MLGTNYILPELQDKATYQSFCPPLLESVIEEVMGSSGWIMNSNGFIPVLPGAPNGDLHRDIRSMFTWKKEANGDAMIADALDCKNLPDFYFTAIIYLTDIVENDGGT